MYELLIRIETLFMDTGLVTLLGVGAAATVVGVLLWLAGTHFSSAIIGLLGAVVGAFCGLFFSQWLNFDAMLSMVIGAVVLCIAAFLFRNIIIIVLAIIVFALASGTAFSSWMLGEPGGAGDIPAVSGFDGTAKIGGIRGFSSMDPAMRLSYLNQIAEEQQGFSERLKAVLRDTMAAMSPHKWKLISAVLAGAIVGFLLIRVLKPLVIAISCSGVGALLVLVGVEGFAMAVGSQVCNAFRDHRFALTITYFAMVAVGAAVQLYRARARKLKAVKARKD